MQRQHSYIPLPLYAISKLNLKTAATRRSAVASDATAMIARRVCENTVFICTQRKGRSTWVELFWDCISEASSLPAPL